MTDQVTPGSRSTWAALLRVVIWWDDPSVSLGCVSSVVVAELTLGLPGGLLVVLRRGSDGSWGFGGSGFRIVFRISGS